MLASTVTTIRPLLVRPQRGQHFDCANSTLHFCILLGVNALCTLMHLCLVQRYVILVLKDRTPNQCKHST